DSVLGSLPLFGKDRVPAKTPTAPTAMLLVNGYNGIGIHSFLAIQRSFPNYFKNFVFLSVAVLDTGRFTGPEELARLEDSIKTDLQKYVDLANGLGLYAESRYIVETDVTEGLETLCDQAKNDWPRRMIFAG